MKYSHFFLLIIFLASGYSCKKSVNNIVVQNAGADVYVSGVDDVEAIYWKNGIPAYLPIGSYASSISFSISTHPTLPTTLNRSSKWPLVVELYLQRRGWSFLLRCCERPSLAKRPSDWFVHGSLPVTYRSRSFLRPTAISSFWLSNPRLCLKMTMEMKSPLCHISPGVGATL